MSLTAAPASSGIVGLYLKNSERDSELGEHMAGMLERVSPGPRASAMVAVYGPQAPEGWLKLSLHHAERSYDWPALADRLGRFRGCTPELRVRGRGAVIAVRAGESALRDYLRAHAPDVSCLGAGGRLELWEEDVSPAELSGRLGLHTLAGSHWLGHIGSAAPHALAAAEAELFPVGLDLCVVHHGALGRPHRLQEKLRREGIELHSQRDAALAAAFLTWQLQQGANLAAAMQSGVTEFAGFGTLAVGTRDGLAVVRNGSNADTLLLAEHEDYVAMASERAIFSDLPDIDRARIWHPTPGTLHVWARPEAITDEASDFLAVL